MICDFSEEELRLLVSSVETELSYGGNPLKMKVYCELYDKLIKLIKKE